MKMFFHYNRQVTSIILISIMTTLIGCVADKTIIPSLEGKPRIKINEPQSVNKEMAPLINSKTTTRNYRETSDDRSADR